MAGISFVSIRTNSRQSFRRLFPPPDTLLLYSRAGGIAIPFSRNFSLSHRLGILFKMLVIYRIFPVAAPCKAFFGKQPVAEVFMVNHVLSRTRPVNIGGCVFMIINAVLHIGVLLGINIYGAAVSVIGQALSSRHFSEIKSGGVVHLAGESIVRLKIIHQIHGV